MRGLVAALAVVGAMVAATAVAASPTSAGLLPVAVNDSYAAVHGKLRTVAAPGVFANDLQLGSGFTAKRVNNVDHGSLHLNANGGFTYQSDAKFVGSDTFTYRVDGGVLGLSNVATVTIAVTNDAPVARPDGYTAVADVDRSIAKPGVLGNDSDADGDQMKVDVVQDPAHGNLDAHDDGSFKYKADKGFSGTDTWRYRVWDGVAWSNTVTVTMTVSLSATATPRPTATPTPDPTPLPTPRPIVSLPPLPPLPSLLPLPTALPTPRVTAPPTPRPTAPPTPMLAQSPTPTAVPAGPLAPGGPVVSPSSGPSGGPRTSSGSPTAARPPFTLPSVDDGGELDLQAGALTFDGFEWAVPALVMTVPGILLVIAVLAQALIGLAWLPVARRWLGGDQRRRPPAARVAARWTR